MVQAGKIYHGRGLVTPAISPQAKIGTALRMESEHWRAVGWDHNRVRISKDGQSGATRRTTAHCEISFSGGWRAGWPERPSLAKSAVIRDYFRSGGGGGDTRLCGQTHLSLHLALPGPPPGLALSFPHGPPSCCPDILAARPTEGIVIITRLFRPTAVLTSGQTRFPAAVPRTRRSVAQPTASRVI